MLWIYLQLLVSNIHVCAVQFVTWLLVLQSYMEDHLKNTERLEQEWTALCNYTPDQCDVEAGKLNPTRNRYPSILPCRLYTYIVACTMYYRLFIQCRLEQWVCWGNKLPLFGSSLVRTLSYIHLHSISKFLLIWKGSWNLTKVLKILRVKVGWFWI